MTNESKEWIKPTILELREWGCNKLADLLASELEEAKAEEKEESK